jgi:hypothetical protein
MFLLLFTKKYLIESCVRLYSRRFYLHSYITYVAPGRALETSGLIQNSAVTTYSRICTYFLLSLPKLVCLHTNTKQGSISGRHRGSTPKSVTAPHHIHKNSLADIQCGGTLYMCEVYKCCTYPCDTLSTQQASIIDIH